MTAMEIYREDRQNRKKPDMRLPRQEYYALLRDTLHDELMRQGRSEFLDEMLAECEGGKALPMLEFAALRECYEMIVEGQPMQDATEYVPHIYRTETERFAWRELGSGAAYRVDNPEFPQLLSRLKAVSRQLVSVRDQTLAPDVNRAAQREIDGLLTLMRTLESENAQLRQEREALKARIAELEEGCISENLRMRLEIRRRQAEGELEAEMAKRREEAEGSLLRAIGEAAQRRQGHEADDRAADEAAQQRAAEYSALRADVRAQARELQAQLARQLDAWEGRMRGADHRFLAGSCAAMLAAIRHETACLLAQAQLQGVLTAETAQLQAALDRQARQLEQALVQLGLRVFWPAEGEPFDSRLHSPMSAHGQDGQSQIVIERVETPGVLLLRETAQPEEALVRAVVYTRVRE